MLAYIAGIVIQRFSIMSIRRLGFGQGVIAALSIVAYETGMFLWMG